MRSQVSFFDNLRMSLEDSINVSLNSLRAYGEQYRHWCIAYSGGKDSTATVSLVAWAVRTGQVQAPESLTVLYADTRQELPPLQAGALRLMATLRGQGINARVVLPEMDARYFVYMLGRGVPPPTIRWDDEEQNGSIPNQSRKRLERVAVVPLIKPAGMGDCPQCSFGLINPPPLTGSLPLYRERCLQFDMHEFDILRVPGRAALPAVSGQKELDGKRARSERGAGVQSVRSGEIRFSWENEEIEQ